MNVLLVDDDAAVRLTFGALLEDDGHVVIEAASVGAARDHLRDDYQLAVVDLHLPDGDGTRLIPEIRAVRPDAVIVLMTGDDVAASGADLVVAKHCPPSEVVARAEAVLAARRAGA